MSKIICDICGTTYPDTAQQCPICGCARDSGSHMIVEEPAVSYEAAPRRSGSHVKGGRFSASNVRKRAKKNSGYQPGYFADETVQPKSNKGLVILLVLVILALVSVSGYIFVRFYLPNFRDNTEVKETVGQTESTAESTEETEPKEIPCTSIAMTSAANVELEDLGLSWLVNVVVLPSNTTDTLTYSSSDEMVATVDDEGKITSVGAGEATIYITCGEKQLACYVTVTDPNAQPETEPEVTTEATEETTEATEALMNITLTLNKTDLTFVYKGETCILEVNSELSAEDVIWTTDNAKIATIKNGVLTAVGSGTTWVYAKYGDQIVGCIVRCRF